jgi:N-acetylmuramoyl-L-alanine amidase
MRKINFIAIHCTACSQDAKLESILKYWRENLKWKSPGYHYLIMPNGYVNNLLDEKLVSNGVAGYNSQTVNVCYMGGVDKNNKPIDNRTVAQKESLLKLLKELRKRYPEAVIQGHYQFPDVKKACPCFDAKQEYRTI